MKNIWIIHRLALAPLKVYTIAFGIAFCLAWILLAGYLAGLTLQQKETYDFIWAAFDITPQLLTWQNLHWLLLAFFAWLIFWSTLGSGITRVMMVDILGLPQENLWQATKFCLRPALIFPSFLACLCFLLIFMVKLSWLWLLPILPIWLYAGLIYAALCEKNRSLKAALKISHQKFKNWKQALRLQLKFMCSFLVSTVLVYSFCSILILPVYFIFKFNPYLIPILGYALGYTTSNLKSLQIYLYLQLNPHD